MLSCPMSIDNHWCPSRAPYSQHPTSSPCNQNLSDDLQPSQSKHHLSFGSGRSARIKWTKVPMSISILQYSFLHFASVSQKRSFMEHLFPKWLVTPTTENTLKSIICPIELSPPLICNHSEQTHKIFSNIKQHLQIAFEPLNHTFKQVQLAMVQETRP